MYHPCEAPASWLAGHFSDGHSSSARCQSPRATHSAAKRAGARTRAETRSRSPSGTKPSVRFRAHQKIAATYRRNAVSDRPSTLRLTVNWSSNRTQGTPVSRLLDGLIGQIVLVAPFDGAA